MLNNDEGKKILTNWIFGTRFLSAFRDVDGVAYVIGTTSVFLAGITVDTLCYFRAR